MHLFHTEFSPEIKESMNLYKIKEVIAQKDQVEFFKGK